MCLHLTGATFAVLLGVNLLHVDLNLISLGLSFSYCVCYWFSVHKSVTFVCCFVSHFLYWISKENTQTCHRCALTHVYCISGYLKCQVFGALFGCDAVYLSHPFSFLCK
jgi:hypothetical protein